MNAVNAYPPKPVVIVQQPNYQQQLVAEQVAVA